MTTQTPDAPAAPHLYLLILHEPYWPPHSAREVNATIVAAATLLHRHVLQPDGLHIHTLLSHRRREPGEIVPLATLTHELAEAGWGHAGEWEHVTTDLLALTRLGECHGHTVAMPAVQRALLCSGPDAQITSFNPHTGARETHGPAERARLLHSLTDHVRQAEVARPLWAGDTLLPKPPPGPDDFEA
ncbi:hypothetical protein [Streptomyces spectabilis]|uniref:Uncharacterized protein n=1 Tax=Streptomyces spectabilis TaxID=68270 RepID=A0A7W8B436_STRST|nr:hypothetical protein [Streptomyces spectabilis]MBB5109341.1 hypothetical protein [Streptomyces spectabilis]GGV52512.1 hypothetical protein GCM10010245_82730 [Streptomyces spectabilis]